MEWELINQKTEQLRSIKNYQRSSKGRGMRDKNISDIYKI